ncbi:MAG: ROK family protein [Chloroflexia bacterium]|nr:ROK family protein [Chloroflexia bacterium]MDQ3412474.1 ROK family protein [Chloroflexota bacterium]
MAAKYGLGIDYGGTKILGAVVDLATGQVIGSAKKRTSFADGSEELLERIISVGVGALKSASLKAKDLEGIGLGAAGQVDAKRGVLLGTPNLSQAVVDLPVAKRLADEFKVPATLANDVHVAALGEARFGAGVGAESFLCVFVGTGIGGAIVLRGKLMLGRDGTAGEIGHATVVAGGRLCGCGGAGHLEAYAARTAISRRLLGEMKRGRNSILSDLEPDLVNKDALRSDVTFRSGTLATAIEEKDALVIEAVREAGWYLGIGLASAVNIVNPDRIILGGGAIEALPLMVEVARETVRAEALPVPAKSADIVTAGLGDHSGVVGAAIIGAESGRK